MPPRPLASSPRLPVSISDPLRAVLDEHRGHLSLSAFIVLLVVEALVARDRAKEVTR